MKRRDSFFFPLLLATSVAFTTQDLYAAVGRTEGLAAVSKTGSATYSIPLDLPDGANGLNPGLALVYSHQGGTSSISGFGWSLVGLGAVTRCPRTKAQDGAVAAITTHPTDRLCLNGEQLKLVSGANLQPGSEYRTEIDSFARIKAVGTWNTGLVNGILETEADHFTVEAKDGLIYEYGGTADSRLESPQVGFRSPAREWSLSQIRDRAGNQVNFVYDEDTSVGTHRLAWIEYSSNPAAGVSEPAYRIDFEYGDRPERDIKNGFYVTARSPGAQGRLTGLSLYRVQGSGAAWQHIRRYVMAYEPSLSSASHSRLQSVKQCSDYAAQDCLAPTTFTYQDGDNTFGTTTSTSIVTTQVKNFAIDVNGDGRTDLVYPSSSTSGAGTWLVALANTDGTFAAPLDTGISNSNFNLATPIDYNADGRVDLLVTLDGLSWSVLQATASGGLVAVNTVGPVAGAIEVRAVDFNGDGFDDLVWSDGSNLLVRLRVPGGTYSLTANTLATAYHVRFVPTEGDRRYGRPADFNGDGASDVLVSLETFSSNPFNGGGLTTFTTEAIGQNFGRPVVTGQLPLTNAVIAEANRDGFSDLYYPTRDTWYFQRANGQGFDSPYAIVTYLNQVDGRAVSADVDADGLSDLLIPLTGGNWQYIRSRGFDQGFDDPVDTGLAAHAGDSFGTDVDGDGLRDLLTMDSTGRAYVNLHKGAIPDLLKSATDGFGNGTTFSYASLSSGVNYSPANTAAFPYQDFQGGLAVVRSTVSTDGIGGTYTVSYSYAGAVIERQGRGFAGFASVASRDSRLPGLEERRTFRQDFPYIGAQASARTTKLSLPADIIEDQVTYAQLTHNGLAAYETQYVIYPSQTTHVDRELSDGTLVRTVSTTNTLDDASGTVSDSTTTVTEAAGAHGASPNDVWSSRTHVTDLRSDLTNWCLGKAWTVEDTRTHGAASETRSTQQTWDTSCRAVSKTLAPGNSTLELKSDREFDAFGNLKKETSTGIGMPPRTTQMYWGAKGLKPETITDAEGLVTNLTWNYSFSKLEAAQAPNGAPATVSHFDAFGREDSVLRLDQTKTTRSFSDCPANCAVTNAKQIVVETDYNSDLTTSTDRTLYLDGLDRVLLTRAKQVQGTYYQVDREYDALGLLRKQSAPHWSTACWPSCTAFWAENSYDLLGRLKSTSRPTSDSDASLSSTSIDYLGLTTTYHDELNRAKIVITDVLGRTVRVTDASGSVSAATTNYAWDGFNQLKSIALPDQTAISNDFNIRGFRTAVTTPDTGLTTLEYWPTGELRRYRDANTAAANASGWTSELSYDRLGRMLSRFDTKENTTTTWTWDLDSGSTACSEGQTGGRGKALLSAVEQKEGATVLYSEKYCYDDKGRVKAKSVSIPAEGGPFGFQYTYAANGQLGTMKYPAVGASRLTVKYEYQNGIVWKLSNESNPVQIFWQVGWRTPRGQWRFQMSCDDPQPDFYCPFGKEEQSDYDYATGLVKSVNGVFADYDATIPGQLRTYTWDGAGNMKSRSEQYPDGSWYLNAPVSESFEYDELNRLDKVRNTVGAVKVDVDYFANGSISLKSDLGGTTQSYVYGDSAHPHAVTCAGTNGYHYDANGNMDRRAGTCGSPSSGSPVTWYSYNLPKRLEWNTSAGNRYSEFLYGPERQRYKQIASGTQPNWLETTVYVDDLFEKRALAGANPAAIYDHVIRVEGVTVGIATMTLNWGSYVNFNPMWNDALGSAVKTGVNGSTQYFDAWGRRGNATSWTGDAVEKPAYYRYDGHRGYTGHEHLDSVGLIHMNGRVYHPFIGRFLSPDPVISDLYNTQALNPYSYVEGRTLSATDPTGYHTSNLCVTSVSFDPYPENMYSANPDDVIVQSKRPDHCEFITSDDPFDFETVGTPSFSAPPTVSTPPAQGVDHRCEPQDAMKMAAARRDPIGSARSLAAGRYNTVTRDLTGALGLGVTIGSRLIFDRASGMVHQQGFGGLVVGLDASLSHTEGSGEIQLEGFSDLTGTDYGLSASFVILAGGSVNASFGTGIDPNFGYGLDVGVSGNFGLQNYIRSIPIEVIKRTAPDVWWALAAERHFDCDSSGNDAVHTP